ncbi:MAG: tRNA (adenosine(37)-N6)-threonylcarbamoyltransferase complex ATPase subunit type 1 TsaE [Candidatus Saccharibacteria bacterium]|nr:tRNA (adenosine(37)-N6)-threonylcarbamoyltransferase complex ATPase subunit type 1 TsaE [Candidatus Saccharibacteria bacterium]
MASHIQVNHHISNLQDLEVFTKNLANQLQGSETLELISDLGGGKTTFVRFLAKFLKSQDPVCSPSFTIENIYRCPDFNIHHFDFYRLEEPGVCQYELAEALANPKALVIVEWSRIVKNVLPNKRLVININPRWQGNDPNQRDLHMTIPPSLKYLAVA